jgi:myosin heavy subunit
MEPEVVYPNCDTPLCTSLARFYIPVVAKYSCSACFLALFSKLPSVNVSNIEEAKESIYVVETLLSNIEVFLDEYVNYPWPQLGERLKEWKIKVDDLKDRLKETIRQNKYYGLDTIRDEAVTMKNKIQEEDVYQEFLLTQENKNINLRIRRSLLYKDVHEAISYDKHMIFMGALKDDLKEAYEQKIEQLERDLTTQHRNQIEQMVKNHTAEVLRFQTEIQTLEQEKRGIDELNASIRNERVWKIDELSQNLLDSKKEKDSLEKKHEKAIQGKDKTIKALTNEIGELQNTIKSMTNSHKDQINDLSSKNINLSSKNDSLQIQIDALKKFNKDEMMQLRIQNSEFEVKTQDLKNQNNYIKDIVKSLESQVNSLTDQIKARKREYLVKVNELSSKNDELVQTIEELNTEIRSSKSHPIFSENENIQNLLTEIFDNLKSQWKQSEVEEEDSQVSQSQFDIICGYITKNCCIEFSWLNDDELQIELICNDQPSLSLLKILSNSMLTDLSSLMLHYVPYDSEDVHYFLSTLKANKLKKFSFNYSDDALIDITPYMENLKEVWKLPSLESLTIYWWIMNWEQVIQIFSSAKHLKHIGLEFWSLELNEQFEFGDSLDGAAFESLRLDYSSKEEFSGFWFDSFRFENLIEALDKVQSVKDNLKELHLNSFKQDEIPIADIMRDNKLKNCKVIIHNF